MTRYTMTMIEDQFRERYTKLKTAYNEVVAVVMPAEMVEAIRHMTDHDFSYPRALTYNGLPVFVRDVTELDLEMQMVLF